MRSRNEVGAEDPRTEVRVFLGSSEELREERAGFAQALAEIGERPDLRRAFALSPVRWETDAFGFSADINETIQSTVEFDRLHVIIIVVWNRVGQGTLEEYETALRLERFRGRPRLAVYVREPAPDADPVGVAEVRAFQERVIADGGVPNSYATPEELWERLSEQLPRLLPQATANEPSAPGRLRALFLTSTAATLLLSLVVLLIVSFMSFPGWNTTYLNVLTLLLAPPVIFLGFTLSLWAYHRLLNSLKTVWRSPQFDDQAVYEIFRNAVPRFAIPQRLKAQFPKLPGSQLLQALILALAFVVPGVAQYQGLFQEILLWQYVVGSETIDGESGPAAPGADCVRQAEPGCVRSRWVDCAHREWLTFGLRDQRVREFARVQGRPVIFIHAHCRFALDADLPPDQGHLHNRGPEIFLPQQPMIYFGLIILTALGVAATGYRLARFPREFAQVENASQARRHRP